MIVKNYKIIQKRLIYMVQIQLSEINSGNTIPVNLSFYIIKNLIKIIKKL